MVWVKGPNYGGPTTEGATHGSSSGSSTSTVKSGSTRAMAPPGREPTKHHDLVQQVAPPQMNTNPLPSESYNNPDQNINLVNELQALLDATPTEVAEIPGQIVSNDDRIWNLATQAYADNPGYELSWEGQQYAKDLAKKGITKGSPEYEKAMIQYFGMPQVTSNINQVEKVNPMDPKYAKSFQGQELIKRLKAAGITEGSPEWNNAFHNEFVPELQLSGQGKYLMDRYDEPGKYEDKTAEYYEMREAQQQGQNNPGGSYYGDGGGGSEGGSGYGYGYSGDDYPPPQGYQRAVYGPGTLQEQVNRVYLAMSGLQKKRGGIISLLELR